MMEKRVFVSTDFPGYWPVGSAAVILAANEIDARLYLANELERRGLKAEFSLRDITDFLGAEVLCDGNY
jgi:hypothetical protein